MRVIECPHCGARGALNAMISHDCEEVRQEPTAAFDLHGLDTNDICRRLAIQHAIVADLDDVDLELRLAMSLDWVQPRLLLMQEQLDTVKAAVRGGRVPRDELLLLAAQVQHWLEDIDRKKAQ